MMLEPIGTFHCAEKHPYDAARQPALAGHNPGCIRLLPGRNFEQALIGLEGFSHIWIVYCFDRNPHWKPMVQPPRAAGKVGVFATRAPYRPNPIGLSCVRLEKVDGLQLHVRGHDLLDGTPVLDIKPYIAYADSHPDATAGWLNEGHAEKWDVRFSAEAEKQLAWLEENGAGCIRAFALQQLGENPFDAKRKRIVQISDDTWEIAYRTWRLRWTANAGSIVVFQLRSAYDAVELHFAPDPHADKELHRDFAMRFAGGSTA